MREFLAIERCDRCGARALHAAQKDGFTELLFCNHHLNEFATALFEDGWQIESEMVLEESATASAYTE